MAGWTIPDKGEGDNDVQSILFQEYLDVLVDGIQGINIVVSGCAVTGGADMTPEVAKGAIISNGVMFPVTAGTFTIGAAHATLPRIDLVVIDSSGAKQTRAGTAATYAKPPVRTANDVVLAAVYVPANDTSIETTKITDLRVFKDRHGVTLKKSQAATTFNNSTADNSLASVVLPSGLFLAGRTMRFQVGGTYLLNSGTPTMTLRIYYGGTVMFGDVSLAATAGATRGSWWVEGLLGARTNSSQVVQGMITYANTLTGSRLAGSVAGFGDILGSNAVATRPVTSPFSGTAAVDSDAADRTFSVNWAMTVANAADEIVCDQQLFELM